MIPVYINVRNRLTTTRVLADQVAKLVDAVPILIDNDSDWPPLLEWYETCPHEVVRLSENLGHHAPWKSGIVEQSESEFYVVTDCDLDIAECQPDLMELLKIPFGWKMGIIKSGLGLRIDDLPEWQSAVLNWERQFWKRPVRFDDRFYWAAVDTTFAMYRTDGPMAAAQRALDVRATRTRSPLARHVPWYLDGNNLDEENSYYFQTANKSNSWVADGKSLRIRGS